MISLLANETLSTGMSAVVAFISMPGIIAGSILVFVPSLGAYVTPEILGGAKTTLLGSYIVTQFLTARNWPVGASLSFVLMAIAFMDQSEVFLWLFLFLAMTDWVDGKLAILLDQRIRGEGVLRPIYLYPMALSFIVTGTAWKWMLNPTLGIQKMVQDWGFTEFTFDWLVNRDMSIYTIVIAGVWQSSGFVMANPGRTTEKTVSMCQGFM